MIERLYQITILKESGAKKVKQLTTQDIKEGEALIEKYEALPESEQRQVKIYIGALWDRKVLQEAEQRAAG